jgi:hypothetical protein
MASGLDTQRDAFAGADSLSGGMSREQICGPMIEPKEFRTVSLASRYRESRLGGTSINLRPNKRASTE